MTTLLSASIDLVCDKVIGGKPWFGAFAFGDGNPYKPGRFWLHKDHDLVFRTYIGKTPEQVALNQKNIESLSEKEIPDNNYDAIVISDYNKGLLTQNFIDHLCEKYNQTNIFVDTKNNL